MRRKTKWWLIKLVLLLKAMKILHWRYLKMIVDTLSMTLTLSLRTTVKRARSSSLLGLLQPLGFEPRCYMQHRKTGSDASLMVCITRFKQLTLLKWSLTCSRNVCTNRLSLLNLCLHDSTYLKMQTGFRLFSNKWNLHDNNTIFQPIIVRIIPLFPHTIIMYLAITR